MKIASFTFFSFLALTLSAQAIVTFTAVGQITSVGGGAFALDQTITVTFSTASDLGVPNEQNDGFSVEWDGYLSPNPIIWSDVSIDTATGTYIPASTAAIGSNTGPFLYLVANGSDSIGLTVNTEEVSSIEMNFELSGTYATYPGDLTTSPETVFYNGTYSMATTLNTSRITTDSNVKSYSVTYSSLTISGAQAVPEPQTYALVFGGLVLMGVMLRRKYKRG